MSSDQNVSSLVTALESLLSLARATLPALIEAPKQNRKLRLAATRALRATGSSEAIPALVAVVSEDTDNDIREAAGKALAALGAEAVRALVVVLNEWLAASRAGKVRAPGALASIAMALARFGQEARSAVPALTTAFVHTSDAWARTAVTEALCRIGPEARAALPALVDALTQSRDPNIRACAIAVLTSIGPEATAAVPALLEALDDEGNESWLRRDVREALLAIRGQE